MAGPFPSPAGAARGVRRVILRWDCSGCCVEAAGCSDLVGLASVKSTTYGAAAGFYIPSSFGEPSPFTADTSRGGGRQFYLSRRNPSLSFVALSAGVMDALHVGDEL